ncbi:MAG: hypothetical protein DCC75_11345 [Proteobacteria bacterium]|nr:MAG: hypothetical protein DCC75_11345 [Pseudomonadota bacterium]
MAHNPFLQFLALNKVGLFIGVLMVCMQSTGQRIAAIGKIRSALAIVGLIAVSSLPDSAFARYTAHSRGNLTAAERCLVEINCPPGTTSSLVSLLPSSNCGGGVFALNGKPCWKAVCECVSIHLTQGGHASPDLLNPSAALEELELEAIISELERFAKEMPGTE